MAKTPAETAEWLHRITLEGYGDGFMEAADVIRDLASKLEAANKLLRDIKADLEMRARVTGEPDHQVVAIGATLWNRLCRSLPEPPQ